MFYFLFLLGTIFSNTFMNSYLEMDMPSGFKCNDEVGSKWVCVLKRNIQDFTVVTNAVTAGPYDNNAGFMGFFGKKFEGFSKKAKFMYIKSRDINGHTWIEAQHKNSEREGYISRYLITNKKDSAFIAVFNLKESKSKEYAPKLYAMVQSLKLRADFIPKKTSSLASGGLLGYLTTSKVSHAKKRIANFANKITEKAGVDDDMLLYIIVGLVVLVLIVVLVIRRRRRRKKRNKQFF